MVLALTSLVMLNVFKCLTCAIISPIFIWRSFYIKETITQNSIYWMYVLVWEWLQVHTAILTLMVQPPTLILSCPLLRTGTCRRDATAVGVPGVLLTSGPSPPALCWKETGPGFGFPSFLPSVLLWAWPSVPRACVVHPQGGAGELCSSLGSWAMWMVQECRLECGLELCMCCLCCLFPWRKLNPPTMAAQLVTAWVRLD